MIEAFLRYHFSDADQRAARRACAPRGGLPAGGHDDRGDDPRGRRRPPLEARSRLPGHHDLPDRGAGIVGVHQPGARLRAAARRRADPRIRGRLADQRGAHDRGIGCAGGRARRRRARAAARQLRRLDGGAAGALVDDATPPAPASRGGRRAVRSPAAVRSADGAGGGLGVRAQHHRPLLRLPRPQSGAGGPLLDRDQAGRSGRVHRPRVPVRVAAAGLLRLRRRRGGAAVRARDDLLRAGQRLGRRWSDAAGALGPAAARRALLLRRLPSASLGLARDGRCTGCGSCSW